MLYLESIAYDLYFVGAASTDPPCKALQERPVITHFSNPTNATPQECIPNLIKPEYFRVSESKRCSPVKQRQVQRQQDLVVLFDFQGTHGQDGLIEHDCRTETCIVKKRIVFHQDDLEFVLRVDT